MASAAAMTPKGGSRQPSSDEENFKDAAMEERDFTHQYYVVEREDFKDAEAFQDFNPDSFRKNLYTTMADANFSTRVRRFLLKFASIFAVTRRGWHFSWRAKIF